MSAPGPDLGAIHRIDQAQASAFARISTLLEWITDWVRNQGFDRQEMLDAIDDPMAFVALVKIMQERVDVRELPNMMAAAIVRIARHELDSEGDK